MKGSYVLDSSAIVAVLCREPTGEKIEALLLESSRIAVGSPTILEAAMVMTSRQSPIKLEQWLDFYSVVRIPFGERHVQIAVEAFETFGKGRHQASLNFGDCMAYAIAKLSSMQLIYVGDDFSKTDLDCVQVVA